jgi:hypothetical protein
VVIVDAVFTDINFFKVEYPDKKIEFILPILLTVPQVLG